MNKKGFTLMELLTVVVIVGVLTSVALPQYRKVVERGRFTKAQVMAKALHDSCVRLVSEWGVETYTDLPAAAKTISRLDIGSPELLPPGFSIESGYYIQGQGFQYSLTGNCEVTLLKTSGTYSNTKMKYNGTSFYNCNDDGSGACDVYNVD